LLRRVHRNHYTPGQPIALFTRDAFKPTQEDTDGISLQRESDMAAAGKGPSEMSAAGRKPGEYFIIRLKAKDYLNQGLSIVPDQQPGDLPGHSIIPELSLSGYQNKKQAMKNIQDELIKLASVPAAIVLSPSV
jgi:hypothetical protein